MNLTKIAFTYRKSILMVLALLLINGVFAYLTLPAQENPTITIRKAIVTTSYPGMAPERVEQLITRAIEKEIRKIPEVEKLTSTSMTGQSVIHVEIYDRYFNLDNIWQDLRNKVKQAQLNLPEGTSPPFVNDSFGDVSVVTLALTADGFDLGEMYDISKHIRDNLYSVAGTKKVDIIGVQAERIYLEVKTAKLAQLGISPRSIISELQNQNIISPGGQIDTGLRSIVVEPTGNFSSLEEIGNTHIRITGTDDTIALKDIVSLRRGFIDPPDKPAYFNGEPAIMFGVSMLQKYNLLEYAPRVKNMVTNIENTLPIGYKINIATYQADQVQKSIEGVSINVIQTLVIVLLVVIYFLGLRTGLIVGSIVPFVMLTTLAIMKFSGMTLEKMSLATLIIALGLLVDNGIVIAEDFKRRIEQGIDRFDAMCQGGKELAMPLLSSSVTTILFFLPLMLAEHVAGEFTRSVSLVILITLMTSWVLALCVTPTLCYFFIKAENKGSATTDKPTENSTKFYQIYEKFLHWVLAHKAIFMTLMVVTLIVSLSGFGLLKKQFFPDSDRTQVMMYIDLPNGTSARETNRQMQEVFTWLDDKTSFPEISNYSGYSGFNGPRFVLTLNPEDPANNKGFVVINVKDETKINTFVNKLHNGIIENFPNVSGRVKRMFAGPSDSSTISIQVKGPDKDILYEKAKEIMSVLQAVPHTKNVRTDWENRIVKMQVKIDQHRARRAGVTSSDVATALQGYFSGANVTEYRDGDDIIPVVFRAEEEERFNLDRLRTVSIFSNQTGSSVPLFQVADFIPVNQYAKIQRENMFTTITIEASNTQMTAEDLKGVIDGDIQALKKDLPVNHLIEYDGVIVQSKEAQQALGASMPMVIGLVLILLVMQFNSFRRASIIVLTIPLSLIGTVVGLLVMNAPFGFMVTLGIYSLAGIIINNAIVLIDRIEIERATGQSDYQAIVNSCLTRLRPITMTTVTTIMGLLPLLIDPMSMFYGMATVLAFGLGVGTILTLAVVPVLYASFFKISRC
ncbi:MULTISPECIES: efflux RND transporter permease subunit [unclassified Colwellia]|uniref:efflux RND transporter permease subunit n=1 Tax=unclassified Colwellia TaxID=196834 RepID=UPI0015F3993C|nr:MULTISPECIES: efflux RND transporter permease subunit [unclassified Colwellia]MBA6349109.1 efflux RND transporter permease subunit [Colwellia sp. BRX8-9]MBA6371638.1 efflux RND transporter permease subunit [Colwellia sp. BRX8-4]MBA6380307.1 efflux RND transporter permease subunit [Colwellia sp. BRX10-7]MBA6383385.1 efflux RND transporter permease subunit [Colwellia sp. BRX10-9]MBA6387755.1 efflux RND transporter permease subunit [Colwellia sp. BRX10-2]|tara:strand:- start:498 stop:3557 length:3060 start_codon:yes stop_codon:yes gene_type:complete